MADLGRRAKDGLATVGRSLPAPVKKGAKRALALSDPLAIKAYRLRRGYGDPIPPIRLRARVGTPFIRDFVAGGPDTVEGLELACRSAGRTLAGFSSVLDFGCGCGRVIGAMAKRVAPGTRVIGCDVDVEAITWDAEAYPGIDFAVTPFAPPLPFREDEFDLIYSISIFTHLDEDSQLAWLREIRRVLRPSGLALLTVFNEAAFEDFRTGRVISNSRDCAGRLSSRPPLEPGGFVFEPYVRTHWNRDDFEQITGDYGLAFHSEGYVERAWSPVLNVLDRVTPRGWGDWQQIVVLAPPDGAPG